MTAIVITNLDDVLKAIDGAATKIEQGAQIGIMRAGLEIERRAKKNFVGARKYKIMTSKKGNVYLKIDPPRHTGGQYPNVVTGNLRRSITTSFTRGMGKYTAMVGSSMIYARSVERGNKQNPAIKYPYLEPAALDAVRSGVLQRIFVYAISEKLRG
jgi:phage gpG-like protein